MDLYIFCVVLGAAGMAAMAFLGFTSSHGGHHGHDNERARAPWHRRSARDNGSERETAPVREREVAPVSAPATRGVMPEALQNSGKRGG